MRAAQTLFWSLCGQAVLALPKDKTNDQVGAEIDDGTFQNPSSNVRPRFRYWLPDASADLETVVSDVEQIGKIGGGGLELLGFYLYGGPPKGFGDYAPVDWAKYGWGTDAWHTLLKTFAQATKDSGLVMDLAAGPNQGQGVPAEYDDDGKAWDLAVNKYQFDANTTEFDAVIDGWGTGPLEAAVLAGSPKGGSAKIIDVSTLKDFTKSVDDDGHLKFQLDDPDSYNYILFSVYLVHSQFQAQDSPIFMEGPQSEPANWRQNGSWAIDHFSARGAKLASQFWDEYLLTDGVRELVQEVGNYMWEDSVELKQDYRWTKGFADLFKKQHNYDIQRYLPIIHFGYKTQQWDEGVRYKRDYMTTLATAYGEYLEEWTRWTTEELGIQFSCQVAYGIWMDAAENIPIPNAPEMESLEFDSEIDRYRQYSGPANLAGKRVISNEMGAQIYQAYQQPLPHLVDIFKHVIAGGGNQAVIHGSSYSGDYPNTTWPGYTTFSYQFSDNHNRHEPAWEDYRQSMDFMSRNQQIFQRGKPIRDIVFYLEKFWWPGNTSYAEDDLLTKGYTYEYLSPANFKLPAAEVSDGIFAPSAQEFKVLVVRIWELMTLDGARKIQQYAKDGLTIIFHEGVPVVPWAWHKCSSDQIGAIMNEVAGMDNVHVTEMGSSLADKIEELGIEPRTKVSAETLWYTVWRKDEKNDVDYVFVYNAEGESSEGTVEFASTKIPYFYDAWTGEQTPVVVYEQADSRTKIPFNMHGNQSAIIAFLPEPLDKIPSNHITSLSDDILSATASDESISIKASNQGTDLQATTSDGKSHAISTTSAAPFSLNSWSLTVEHWDAPDDLFNVNITAVKSNTTHDLSELVSWQDIDGLQDVSGRGYYTTTLTWPPEDGDADGAYIDLGRVYHTLTLSVNGERLPPLDVSHAWADIGPYLTKGDNEIEVVIATPLINALRPVWPELRSSATTPLKAIPPRQDYGLKEPIVVTPYKETLL